MPPDQTPSTELLSRRSILVSGVVLGATGLAGCSAGTGSDSVDCSTTAVEHGDGDIFQQATALMSDESVVLLVSLQGPGGELPIESVRIEDSDGNLRDEIPTTDAQEYRHTIGSPPHHGYLTVAAVNAQRDELDSLEFTYHCTEN